MSIIKCCWIQLKEQSFIKIRSCCHTHNSSKMHKVILITNLSLVNTNLCYWKIIWKMIYNNILSCWYFHTASKKVKVERAWKLYQPVSIPNESLAGVAKPVSYNLDYNFIYYNRSWTIPFWTTCVGTQPGGKLIKFVNIL